MIDNSITVHEFRLMYAVWTVARDFYVDPLHPCPCAITLYIWRKNRGED